MNDALGAVIDSYLELRWVLDPVAGTAVGRHAHDGQLARYDPATIREALAALRSYAGSLEEAEADTLDQEIDRTAALHSVRHDVLLLEDERPFERDPSFHLSHATTGIYLLLVRPAGDARARAASLLSRLRALPAFLRTAADALRAPRAPCLLLARAQLPAARTLVRGALDEPSLDLTGLDPLEVSSARSAAMDALETFDAFLAERADAVAQHANGDDGIGRELFDRKLHTAHLIQENATELLRYGTRLRAEAERRLVECAAVVAPGRPWRDVLDMLRADAPRGDALLDEFADAARRARAFVDAHDLVSGPVADAPVLPTPEFLRPLIPVAAYETPAMMEPQQFTGAMYVTASPDGSVAPISRAELAVVALHEGAPGHHLQFTRAASLPSAARRVLTSPIATEGWALYCEELMVETGFLDDPGTRFFQAYFLLWRALRVMLDVSLHTRGMPVSEAARVLHEELGLAQGTARAEALRYAAFPTYQLCYAVGRRDILALREDVRSAEGGAFSLRGFHDALLSYGGLPVPLARWGMGLA